ncbi:MAG: TIGR04086 family membrane protein [Clostridia bacterium]|nr:TIGR04086 family membrane protein [Clostridia bacterium]
MANKRLLRLLAVAKGLLLAVVLTLILMAVLTVAVWRTDMSDSTLTLLNQLLKIGCIAVGTYMAVGRGGESGFLTGAVIGILYMAVGYGVYAALGGSVSGSSIAGEMITGAAAGALMGAVAANMPARRRASRARG